MCVQTNIGGKSGLYRAVQRVTPFRREARTSGTERMYAALSPFPGTGGLGGAGVVKTAKLCTKQNQIGKRLSAARTKLSGRLLETWSNPRPRGMIVTKW